MIRVKVISEIIDFLRRHKRYQGKILDQKEWKRDNSDLFFEKILTEKINDDQEAASSIFGHKDHRYKDLKSRLSDNLVTSILSIQPNSQYLSKPSKKYYALIREIAVAKILMVKTLQRPAMYFARKCYSRAEGLGFYDIMYDATWILKYYYGVMLKKESEYYKYNQKLSNIMTVLELENKAFSYYAECLIMKKKERSNTRSFHEFAASKFDELAPHISECDSSRFQLIARLIKLICTSSNSDFESMLKDSDEAVNYFSNRYKGNSAASHIFLLQKTAACIRLGRYKQGLSTVYQTLNLIDDKNVNWFPTKHNEFFIYMQSGRYQDARRIYLQATNHRRYKNLVPHMKEDWVTGGAYLNYIIETGKLEPHNKFKFRIGKFLNEVPEYSKDRRVKNIPILIAQIIFMIHRKQTGKVIDRMDAIKQYCGRNLRYNEAVRSNAFIMALMEIPKRSFNKIAVERHIGRFTKRLEEVPLHLSGKNFDLEIIPYERLLEYVLEEL